MYSSLFAGRMTELIPRDAPRSENDADIEAAAMSGVAIPIAMHPWGATGAPLQTPPTSWPLQRISSACSLDGTWSRWLS